MGWELTQPFIYQKETKMHTSRKPLAFVDESGFIIPQPTFNDESLKHLRGRFIYTVADLKTAIEEMNQRQEERRHVADNLYGSAAVTMDAGYDVIGDEIKALEGERQTVPSLSAAPTRKRKSGGPSEKLTQPNYAPLPEAMNKPQNGMDLSEEERADLHGIDTAEAVKAMFGQ